MRVLVTGVPGSGKTTLARALAHSLPGAWQVIHWDRFKHLRWDRQPEAVLRAAGDAAKLGHVIVEGCGAVRLLSRDWRPDTVLECLRATLASPSHKGLAGLLRKRLATVDRIRVTDVRQAVGNLESVCGEILHATG